MRLTRVKRHIATGVLTLIVLFGALTAVATAQGGFDSWISLNNTGVTNNYYIV